MATLTEEGRNAFYDAKKKNEKEGLERALTAAADPLAAKVIIDCAYDSYMKTAEIKSLAL